MSNTTSENGNVDDSGPSRDADSPSSVGESLARRLKALSSLLPSLRRDRSKAADSDVGPQQLEACSDHLDDDATPASHSAQCSKILQCFYDATDLSSRLNATTAIDIIYRFVKVSFVFRPIAQKAPDASTTALLFE